MDRFDAVVIGAGLAGLQCAKLLSLGGAKVLIADAKSDPGETVHTTGIFVRKTFEDFRFPAGALGRPVTRVRLYSPSLRIIYLDSDVPEYRIGDMSFIYRALLEECLTLGVEFCGGARFTSSIPDSSFEGGSIVKLSRAGESQEIRTKVLIGADGTGSVVAGDLGLDRNSEWIIGYEEICGGLGGKREPALHCFLDASLAPGYIAWIADDGDECHIGVGGYPERFDPKSALAEFKRTVVPGILDTSGARAIERRGGKIPVGGVLRNIACGRGLLIGDAAGAVSPLTAGGLDPCLRLSVYAAETVLGRLSKGDPQILEAYSGRMFRSKFLPRLFLRTLMRTVRFQFQFELLFSAMTTRAGRLIAEQVFYRRASFPDISMAHPVGRAIRDGIHAGREGSVR